jgi:VWFA-related protein
MGERRRIVLLILLLWVASNKAGAGEPGRFAISQASIRPPDITVYLDLLDGNGEPPGQLPASDISAAIQGEALKVAQVMSFDASGEGVAYVVLVDVSKSIGTSQFTQIRNAIDNWIEGLRSADRMAIFTFGQQYKQLIDFTDDKAKLKAALQNARPTDLQTKLYLALNNAVNLIQRTETGLPNRRVIVVLTDGKDEGSGITADDVRDLIQQSHVPIYAIGYSRLPVQERQQYLEVLNRFATLSGGSYGPAASLQTAYEDMQRTIRGVFVVRLICDGCRADSQSHPLNITLTTGKIVRTDRFAVSLIAPPPPPPAPQEPWWKVALSLKVVLLVILAVSIAISVGVVFRVQLISWIWGSPSPPPPIVDPVIIASKTVSAPQPIPRTRGRSIQLTVVAGKEHGRVDHINLIEKSVIGRDKGCDVSFQDDAEMSARHCELIQAGGYIEVRDLGTTNGTLLNGARLVAEQRVEDGDLIRAGRTEFRINIGGT